MLKQHREYEKIMHDLLAAHKRTYKRAYDKARETRTAVVFDREGDLVEIYPHLEEQGMNRERQHEIGDRIWEKIVPHLMGKPLGVGRTGSDARLFINGVFWVLRNQVSWRVLPAKYGRWGTLYTRFRRWRHQGIWEKVQDVLQDEPAYQWLMEEYAMMHKPYPELDTLYRSFMRW